MHQTVISGALGPVAASWCKLRGIPTAEELAATLKPAAVPSYAALFAPESKAMAPPVSTPTKDKKAAQPAATVSAAATAPATTTATAAATPAASTDAAQPAQSSSWLLPAARPEDAPKTYPASKVLNNSFLSICS